LKKEVNFATEEATRVTEERNLRQRRKGAKTKTQKKKKDQKSKERDTKEEKERKLRDDSSDDHCKGIDSRGHVVEHQVKGRSHRKVFGGKKRVLK